MREQNTTRRQPIYGNKDVYPKRIGAAETGRNKGVVTAIKHVKSSTKAWSVVVTPGVVLEEGVNVKEGREISAASERN